MQFNFDQQDVEGVVALYFLGTVKGSIRTGGTTFPFIDSKGNVRAIQEKVFNTQNHTLKSDFSQGFLHSRLAKEYKEMGQVFPDWLTAYQQAETKVSCLFGEHLLAQYPSNKVALVEAPKTAIYGTLYFGLPKLSEGYIWLAVYNKSSFNNFEKIKVLEGRDVVVFPDLSVCGETYNEWLVKSISFQKSLKNTRFKVSDLLETLATVDSRMEGEDLADFLTHYDWRDFRKGHSNKSFQYVKPMYKKSEGIRYITYPKNNNGQDQKEVIPAWFTDLELFFQRTHLPKEIKLSNYAYIKDVRHFVESHLNFIKHNVQRAVARPYVSRLFEVKTLLSN